MSLAQQARGTSSTPTWRAAQAAQRRSSALGRIWELDLVLLGTVVVSSVLGVVMVYSATRYKLVQSGINPHYYLERDAIFLLIGLAVMLAVTFIDYHRIEDVWSIVYGGVLFSLLVVLLPHLGTKTLGSQRWFQLGPFQLQPSAFAAIAVVIAVAAVAARHPDGIGLRTLLVLTAMAVVPMALVAKQPDLGSAIVIGVVSLVMVISAGARIRHLVLLGIVGFVAVFAVIHLGLLHQYQLNRLTSFLNQSKGNRTTTYNLNQSKIDIGNGGFFGRGLFHDPQTNLQYVPEQQTDFIFTAVGGQLGFVGAASVLALFALMIWRIWKAARNAPDRLGTVVCAGAFGLVAFSVFQNAGMTMGIMPITGIPLPFLSYGGSADIAFGLALGLVMSVGIRSRRRTAT